MILSKLTHKNQRLSRYMLLTLVLVLVVSINNIKPWKHAGLDYKKLIAWDVTSYYGYLPALFIHKDLTLEFTRPAEDWYGKKMMWWPKETKEGRKVFKMTMGLSMLYAPFFLLSHQYAGVMGYDQSGYSEPYEFGLTWSSVFYVVLGLFFLRRTLIRYFSDEVSAYALALVFIGTNLYYYSTTEPCVSHAYSFSLLSMLIYFSWRWHEDYRLYQALLIGLLIGLLALVRPTNAIYAALPFLVAFSNPHSFLTTFRRQLPSVLGAGIGAGLVVLPQLLYWKYATGSWVYYGYGDEKMFLGSPNVLDSLLSYRSGWLVYTPVMLFALIGIFWVPRYAKQFTWTIWPLVVLNVYLISSWWCWWYGGAFGARAYIESYALLAIPLACLLTHLLTKRRTVVWRPALITVGLGFIFLNCFQTLQSRKNYIHWSAMTKDAYWHQFLRLETDQAYYDLLQDPNLGKAKADEDEYVFNPFK